MTIDLLRTATIVSLVILLSQFSSVKQANTPRPDDLCENFLKKWGGIPKELKFSSCKFEKGEQSDKLVSEYIVKGTDAAIVESFLHKKFKMSRLQHVCCNWEPTMTSNGQHYGSYHDRAGYYYEISMGSGETVERDWNRIPLFYIHVTKYMSEI
jgi:hypothetical protein